MKSNVSLVPFIIHVPGANHDPLVHVYGFQTFMVFLDNGIYIYSIYQQGLMAKATHDVLDVLKSSFSHFS